MKSYGDKTLSPYDSMERRKFVYTGSLVFYISLNSNSNSRCCLSHTLLSISIKSSQNTQ